MHLDSLPINLQNLYVPTLQIILRFLWVTDSVFFLFSGRKKEVPKEQQGIASNRWNETGLEDSKERRNGQSQDTGCLKNSLEI